MTLYGYNGTTVQKLLDTELPCNESVISTTGDQSPSKSSKPFFRERSCAIAGSGNGVFALIGRSYPECVLGDMEQTVVAKEPTKWSGGFSRRLQSRPGKTSRVASACAVRRARKSCESTSSTGAVPLGSRVMWLDACRRWMTTWF